MSTRHSIGKARLAAGLSACLVVAGCGGSGGGNGSGNDDGAASADNEMSFDATAGGFGAPPSDPDNKFTYIDLGEREVVDLTDAEAASSQAWDIAFKRSDVRLNGGISGPGSVEGAVADAQEEFYNGDGSPNTSVFFSATPEGELQAFEDVTSASGLTFHEDTYAPAIVGDGTEDGWWLYDFMTHEVSANDDAWWIVRSAEDGLDSYAKLRVSNIVQADRHITFEMYVQGDGDAGFPAMSTTPVEYTAGLGADGGTACYDFDTASEVGCGTDGWDFQVEVSADGRTWAIWTNGGITDDGDAAAFGPIDDPDGYASDADVPHWSVDSAGGVFAESSWYAYSLQGKHDLWPNYRVYVIDTSSAQYKLQILTYYDEAETSGMYTIRVDELP